ncbi:hypothetical protein [Moraxella bovoculi]|uniref:hypothetical protein n=1 Tax=Moraxella bovoculi TaxID=386891 RepID=UPI000624AA7B|nr:hypothetical protein [Moraxella bovoculi]AKG15781.2 hypothetical protein AAX08_07560 [Moraxella bovoculi]
MGLLADSKKKRKEKLSNEFISMYDSVLYLGEPLKESLEYIINCIPYQSNLYVANDYVQSVFIGNDSQLWGDDGFWSYGLGYDNYELDFSEIVKNLTECVNKQFIDTQNPIYNLGFGKKRFLEYLVNDGVEIDQRELMSAQSPTPFFDENMDIDYYTFQSIINERDELRRLVDELKKQGKPKHTKPQGDDLLILGAVMETLASKKVNPYTQKLLIDKIIERFGNINGISESTLAKKFSESKDYIRKENEILL